MGTQVDDNATGVCVDSAGNVIVASYTTGGLDGNTNAGNRDMFLFKLSPPAPVSVSPASGAVRTDVTQTFTATYGDPSGATDIKTAYLLLNTTVSGANAGYMYYNRATGRLYLMNDAKTSWGAGSVVGAGGTALSNGQCVVYCAASSAAITGNNLTLNLNIAFESSFIGAKDIYEYVDDMGGLNSGWVKQGTVFVNAPPRSDSVTPNAGNVQTGATQTFTAKYSDQNGVTDIKNAYMLVNTSNTSTGGAYVYYNRATGKLYLRDDANTSWGAGSVLGAGGTTLTNSHCTVACALSGASTSGNALTLTLKMTFTATFTGARNIYGFADDNHGGNFGWENKGNLNIQTPAAPTTVSLNPASGTAPNGVTQTYTAIYSDTNGASDLKTAYLLFNTGVSSAGAVYMYYDRATNKLYLRDSANASWGTGSLVYAGGTTLTNSRCSVSCATSSSSASGSYLTLTLKITFTSAFAGAKNIYMDVIDNGGLTSGWVAKGTVSVN